VDGSTAAYVTGYTFSNETTFPVSVGPDLTFNGRNALDDDAYVVKVLPDGTGLVYAGYIGGNEADEGKSITVDGIGAAYITGETWSNQNTFPVTGGPDLTYNGNGDGFVIKVNPDGTGLVYASYIGGSGADEGNGISVDGMGGAYITGGAESNENSFPVTVGPDLTFNSSDGTWDVFVAKISGPVLDKKVYLPAIIN
jgi:hypothetical protein